MPEHGSVRLKRHFPVWLLAALLATPTFADDVLVIVMDDLGYNLDRAERVLGWPLPITLGVLPYAPHAREIAERGSRSGKEVIVHQPMEALPSAHARFERGMLEQAMSGERFDHQLADALNRLPQAVGINNHTGSLLTAHRASMDRVMQQARERGLFFLDSRTTAETVAESAARDWLVPTIRRDVFLDHEPSEAALASAFEQALAIARRKGHAVVIAHPYPISLAFLERRFADLPAGIRLSSLESVIRGDRAAGLTASASLRAGPVTLARHGNPGFPSTPPGL